MVILSTPFPSVDFSEHIPEMNTKHSSGYSVCLTSVGQSGGMSGQLALQEDLTANDPILSFLCTEADVMLYS